ncbi:MAG TPA: hypothetical protein VFD03_00880 [Clostridia bacterium]|nr:hypothetical protein [Clostridia bacterium]
MKNDDEINFASTIGDYTYEALQSAKNDGSFCFADIDLDAKSS